MDGQLSDGDWSTLVELTVVKCHWKLVVTLRQTSNSSLVDSLKINGTESADDDD